MSFTSCTSKLKYGVRDGIEITVPSLKKSFNEIVMDYNDMISQNQWNPVRTYGFARSSLSSITKNFNPVVNNNLEAGLGYIFFNTLFFELNEKINRQGNSFKKVQWKNNREKETDSNVEYLVCPRPWKYRVQKVNNIDYKVFYLPSIQMGEYYMMQGVPNRNYNIIDNEGHSNQRAPYVTCFMQDGTQEDQLPYPVQIDHLLRDNKYLIELPDSLHSRKTRVLDPFIPFSETQTNRKAFSSSDFWRDRPEWDNVKKEFKKLRRIRNEEEKERKKRSIEDNMLKKCDCGNNFDEPRDGIIQDHEHGDRNDFRTKWEAKLLPINFS
ncbi:hypothetical protein [Cardinium endosymbiont of Encarsia pergandiella]|uniref:hypothetical protein n=1 Tax=Cardinium endosymbiont of Encarsia pergandiella TaxID=249402 RepID=UPI0004B697D2|nr:hypothetical protein [Cardinium endosymbiont of Encarsia pergandiella]